jgi:hypothetical protein
MKSATRNPEEAYKKKLEKRHGKAKALSILAHRLGRAVYYILLCDNPFDMRKFLNEGSGGDERANHITGAVTE